MTDALSQTLRVVQLVGAIFINARFTAPWCYQSPSAASAAPLLEPGAEKVVIFHLVTAGECYVELGEALPLKLIAGDVVVFPQGHAHRMTSAPGLPPVQGKRLDAVLARRPRQIDYGGGGAATRLICGYLACSARLARMLLAGLPPVVRVNVRGSNAGAWLEASVRYALEEARSPRPAGPACWRSSPRCSSSKCCASHARAGTQAHRLARGGERPYRGCGTQRPASAAGTCLTLEELAHTAGARASVLAERFQQLVGSSPIQYL